MGRFGVNDIDNYGGSGESSFFALKDDGDVARVRFMYNGMDDVVGYAVHEVTVSDKKRYVNCLRDYTEPKSKCPFCESGNFQRVKFYIPVYDVETGEVKIWERGKKFCEKMSAICARYSSSKVPLVAHLFDIERHGKKGDQQTTYEIFEVDDDNTRLEDLPEVPEVLGTVILDKSADDMRAFLDDGDFPQDSGASRRDNKRSHDGDDDRPTGRRTPSTRRGDSF